MKHHKQIFTFFNTEKMKFPVGWTAHMQCHDNEMCGQQSLIPINPLSAGWPFCWPSALLHVMLLGDLLAPF
jgi:hypothetical protein